MRAMIENDVLHDCMTVSSKVDSRSLLINNCFLANFYLSSN